MLPPTRTVYCLRHGAPVRTQVRRTNRDLDPLGYTFRCPRCRQYVLPDDIEVVLAEKRPDGTLHVFPVAPKENLDGRIP